MDKNSKDNGDMRSHKKKPGLLPTIGAYCGIALIAILTIGLIFARSLSDITTIAADTRDNVLPAIISRQRTAVNLERLGRFAETVHRSDNARIRRQFAMAARILSQDSIFEENNNINRQVVDAYHSIEKISRMRDEQDQINAHNTALILRFNPGNANSETLLALKQGKNMLSLLLTADKAENLETVSLLEEKFTMLEDGISSQAAAAALKNAHTFFSQLKLSLTINDSCDKLWREVNDSLERQSDNLSINAPVSANTRFTTIAQKANRAMQTALLTAGALMLALLILMFLTHRNLVVPIISYVQGLNKLGQGEKELDLPEARLRELDDIRRAVERSAILMAQLEDHTNALQTANETLELEIEERENIQKELALSKEYAEAADQAKSDFLAGMSHEIRTPMNTLLGMADLMLEAELTTQQRQYVEIFQSSGEMLLSIINDVLDLSKIEAGEAELKRTVIDLDDLILQTREIVSGQAIQKGLEFIIDVANDVPKKIIGDQVRLRQVLVNLIDNGIKFTDKGEVRLTIHRAEKGGPGALTFIIIDSGIGIPGNVHEQIFHQFTQADASTVRQYGGTGLGLPICRRLVELMGGTIRLKSSLHQGSTFYFTIDFDLPEEQEETARQLPRNMEDLIHILSGDPISILIAEDSESNQALLELYFKKTTCRLAFASDGNEALEKFKNSSYDMVLMDIQMPTMDGYESTRRIRAFEEEHSKPKVPIVAVTANAFKEDQLRCIKAGCTDYLAKPISKAGLLQCVARLIKGSVL